MALTLTSSSFGQGEEIPSQHTCGGAGLSPPLAWNEPPRDTKTFALIVDDPDAPDPTGRRGPFVHWLVFNIQQATRGLALGASGRDLPRGSIEGRNDAGGIGYFGPCPPAGRHRYVFRLYALDTVLPDGRLLTKAELETVMSGHVLATAELVGRYARQADAGREAPL
jgi:Raf kinase inhibitor-like YbhB/YbcL family protein